MSAKRVTVDALSRALCPSIDGNLLPRAISLPLLSAKRGGVTHEQHDAGSHSGCRAGQGRAIHTSRPLAEQRPKREKFPQWAAAPKVRPQKQVTEKKPPAPPVLDPFPKWSTTEAAPIPTVGDSIVVPQEDAQSTASPKSTDPPQAADQAPAQKENDTTAQAPEETADPASKPSETDRVSASTLCRSTSDFPPETADAPTPAIYEALRSLRSWPGKGQAQKIRRLVKYLVEDRGERPNVFLYEALVTANWDPVTGSADELVDIYKEMRTAGIQPSQGWYHSALRLLAIHPNYLTRKTYLLKMEEQDMELTDDGKASVALGLLRDGQNEMALDYWDSMRSNGTKIPEWVSATFVSVLVLRGFVDEAVQLFRQVLKMARANSKPVPLSLWSYILDECSRSLHYEGTKLVWDEMVSPGKINPADGIALNVLNTAARHGDTALATAVIELLSTREVKLGFHHYEPLLESYVHAGNLDVAFRVLGIMNDAGVQPDQPSTRAIFSALKDSPDLTQEVVRILRSLGRVPVAAVNVVLEAVAAAGDMAKTLDVYRQVCDLCQSGPNQQTFILLLNQCRRAGPAVFLVSEMDRFSVRPSPPILDSLIRCFAQDGSLDVALLYLDEMSRFARSSSSSSAAAATPWVSERTLLTVLRRCFREKDERAFALVAEAQKRGMQVDMDTVRKMERAGRGELEDGREV
ncbi:uncharacterized protein B0H64DRAFT_196528 [Chaetomium fimeti]|uniref:Pentatricopeptide repeat-containing protein-mitochondrial domain-containing protein n=1 Tax=Chaetomium fimeti TaxID=1854472 RepID=A0AAE0HFR0_9PEZI|nr:hypothetical protein B0H64DRAFT_196528 [Chaetomium fimeti]